MGTDIKQLLPANIYQGLINSTSPAALNPFSTISQIGGQPVNALVLAPGLGQDGYAITWDNTAGEYTLTAGGGGGGGGTVTSVSVVSANGFDGTVSNPTTTPAITITTTVTGILKGNGTAISAATDADITGSLLTGYVSGAGVVSAADSILSAIQKLDGNINALPTYTFSTGLTDTTGTITNNLSTGIAGGQTMYGGTAASENLTIESTTNATKGLIQLAPSGVTTGLVTIGNPTSSANQRQLRLGVSSNYMDLGTLSSGPGGTVGMWVKQSTPDGTNYVIAAGNAAGDVKVNMAASATNAVIGFSVAGVNRFVYRPNSVYFEWNPEAKSTGALTQTYRFILPGHTAQTAGSEIIGFYIDGTTSIEHDTGAITTQRDTVITNRTHRFVAASTITTAANVSIGGASNGGTNATITTSIGLNIEAAALTNVTTSFGAVINAQTGAANNHAAAFMGGNVGILTSSPNSSLEVAGSFSLPIRAISAADSFSSTDYTLESSGAAYNITLPTAVGITGRIYLLKNQSGSDKTLITTSSQTIDGALTRVITAGNSMMVQSNGTNWIIIG